MSTLRGSPDLPAMVRTLPGDRDPVALFQILRSDPLPVLLQSGRRGSDTGRFSILAAHPFLVLRFRGGHGIVQSRKREERREGDPFPALRAILDRYRVPRVPGLPFVGGAIGSLGYGLRRWLHPLPVGRGIASPWPDLRLALYDTAFVVDHQQGCMHLVATGFPEIAPSRRREKQRLDLARLAAQAASRPNWEKCPMDPGTGPAQFNTPKSGYLEAIRRAQEAIVAGEIYQVNLSHRIRLEGDWNAFALHRQMLERHPGSFAAYLPYRDHEVVCASPERLVRLQGRRAESRPIKGTRRRSPDSGGELESERALAEGPKERAENVMIVDLARNDLGLVCVPGTIRVEELCRIETLPTVHHLVSTVTGRLREDRDRIDLVRALFPGGSMTGAPKIRAMEIIDELEGMERGIYSGSIGYFSFDGDLDLNIVIRTVIVSGRTAHLQVGGAILADSDPEAEYEETLDKARPLLALLEGRRRT